MVEFEGSKLESIMNYRPFYIKGVVSPELLYVYRMYASAYLNSKYSSVQKIKANLDLYDRRVKYFENSQFGVRINEGQQEQDGYISYLYENGLVISEKYFDVPQTPEEREKAKYADATSVGIVANSNIIITDIDTLFETGGVYELSLEEIKMSDKFTVLRHSKNFENNIEKQIILRDKIITDDDQVMYKEQIKKILGIRYPGIK